MMQIVRKGAIGDGKTHIEASMQKLHDEGKWEWMETTTLGEFWTRTIDGQAQNESGFRYVFRIPGDSEF